MVQTFHLFHRYEFILLKKMRTEIKIVPSTCYTFNAQGCTHTNFHICALYCHWLTRGTGEFLCFRDWPFDYFSGGFISHLFGDYANIYKWNQTIWRLEILLRTIVAALLKIKYNGRFVKNKLISRNLQGIFHKTRVTDILLLEQHLMPDYAYPAHPLPHKHTQTNKKDSVCLMTSAHPTSSPLNLFPIPITTNASFLITQLPKIKQNLFYKSWKFT